MLNGFVFPLAGGRGRNANSLKLFLGGNRGNLLERFLAFWLDNKIRKSFLKLRTIGVQHTGYAGLDFGPDANHPLYLVFHLRVGLRKIQG